MANAVFFDELFGFSEFVWRRVIGTVSNIFRGRAGPDFVGADVFCDDSADTDDCAFTDRHAVVDVGAAADPRVFANDDRFNNVRGKSPVFFGAIDEVGAIAYDDVFGECGIFTDLDVFAALDDDVPTQLGAVLQYDFSFMTRAHFAVIADVNVVAQFDIAFHFKIVTVDSALLTHFGEFALVAPVVIGALNIVHECTPPGSRQF